MCQYELWVYTRCRSSSPPFPPLPTSFPEQLLSLPPDVNVPDAGDPTVLSLNNTFPHINYYRVGKCHLSPECAPAHFSYLLPQLSQETEHKEATTSPNPTELDSPSIPNAETHSAASRALQAVPQENAASPNGMVGLQTPTSIASTCTLEAEATIPIHVRHSYCHSCFEILKESIDGDGELCFPIGSDNWLAPSGKSQGKCWIMDSRIARNSVIVDLDYATGIDWAVEFGDAAPPTTAVTTPLLMIAIEDSVASSPLAPISAAAAAARARANDVAREREAMKERAERERIRQSLAATKELEKRRARMVAENMRKRRWKGWEAWGAPYTLPGAPRLARAGAA